jgi:hypothetical protein
MYSHKVLLLNASNMDAFPVYPYAFIQVPAVARQAGIDVICKDSLLTLCLEAYPDLFGLLGFPTTKDKLEQKSPYKFNIQINPKYSVLFFSADSTGPEQGSRAAHNIVTEST